MTAKLIAHLTHLLTFGHLDHETPEALWEADWDEETQSVRVVPVTA